MRRSTASRLPPGITTYGRLLQGTDRTPLGPLSSKVYQESPRPTASHFSLFTFSVFPQYGHRHQAFLNKRNRGKEERHVRQGDAEVLRFHSPLEELPFYAHLRWMRNNADLILLSPNIFPVGNGERRFDTDLLSTILRNRTEAAGLGPGLTVATWRHLHIFLRQEFIDPLVPLPVRKENHAYIRTIEGLCKLLESLSPGMYSRVTR
jgi:hypothetical protein